MVVADATLRLSQYVESAAKWLAMADREGFRVMVVENSGFDLRSLKMAMPSEARARLVVVGLDAPPSCASRRGKGASESLMIDQAIRAIDAEPTEWIAKSTGRLFVRNMPRALPLRDENLSLVMRGTLGGGYVDSRLLIARGETWATDLKDMTHEVDEQEGVFLEHVIARRVIEGERSRALIVGRFRRAPQFVGVSGTTGQRYDGATTLRRLLVSPLEHSLRLIPRNKQF